MARTAEVVRQWNILRAIDAARGGETASLARLGRVSTRTIWRDLAALQEAGFPLYDEKEDRKTRWKLNNRAFRDLTDKGFTLSQLCALYFSRTVLECLAGTPFHEDLAGVFEQIERVLPPRLRQFLDRLPGVLKAKPGAVKIHDNRNTRETTARLLDATLHQRRAVMRYHSLSSRRVKDYLIEPYRVVYAHGGLYLMAFVPEYEEIRTFGIERVKHVTVMEETFEATQPLSPDVFPHSLGAYGGEPEHVVLEFAPRIAPYVRERLWHSSQRLMEQPDGSIQLSLDVGKDWALRSWILTFGLQVRVVSPSSLAQEILDEIEEGR
jgi:proteasome accessory factor B